MQIVQFFKQTLTIWVVAISISLIGWLATFSFLMLPYFTSEIKRTATIEQWEGDHSVFYSLKDAMLGYFVPYALEVVDVVNAFNKSTTDEPDWRQLAEIDGAVDAFNVNFTTEIFQSVNGLTPPTIAGKLWLDGKNQPTRLLGEPSGETPVRTIDQNLTYGMVKYLSVEKDGTSYIAVFRYYKPLPHRQAEGYVGVLLSKQSFRQQLSPTLDSTYNANYRIRRVFERNGELHRKLTKISNDPFLQPAKTALGVILDGDTIWWKGDREAKIIGTQVIDSEFFSDGLNTELEGLNLRLMVRTPKPQQRQFSVAGIDLIRKGVYTIEVIGLFLFTLVLFLLHLTRRTLRRNRIALSHLAHAVKTPVSRIRLNVDTLTENMVVSPDDEKAVLQTISGECERMELAVKGAAMSLQQGRNIISRESVDLLPTLTKTLNAWDRSFESAGIAFTKDIKVSSLQGSFDAGNIAVAVDNILDNALRHTILNKPNLTDGAAKVAVAVAVENGKAIIQIDDTGTGIPKSERKQIFERFQRAKNDAASGVSGLGLGLALVKEIVEAHKGKVSIADSPLGGVQFEMTFPLDR